MSSEKSTCEQIVDGGYTESAEEDRPQNRWITDVGSTDQQTTRTS